MCTHLLANKELTIHLACSEGCKRYFCCNLMHRKVLASSHQHLMAEAPDHRQRVVVQVGRLSDDVFAELDPEAERSLPVMRVRETLEAGPRRVPAGGTLRADVPRARGGACAVYCW